MRSSAQPNWIWKPEIMGNFDEYDDQPGHRDRLITLNTVDGISMKVTTRAAKADAASHPLR